MYFSFFLFSSIMWFPVHNACTYLVTLITCSRYYLNASRFSYNNMADVKRFWLSLFFFPILLTVSESQKDPSEGPNMARSCILSYSDMYWLQQPSVSECSFVGMPYVFVLCSTTVLLLLIVPHFGKKKKKRKAGKLIWSSFTVLSDNCYFQSCVVML